MSTPKRERTDESDVEHTSKRAQFSKDHASSLPIFQLVKASLAEKTKEDFDRDCDVLDQVLRLRAVDPACEITVRQGVDLLWQKIVLHTADYRAHCEKRYGVFVEYAPGVPTNTKPTVVEENQNIILYLVNANVMDLRLQKEKCFKVRLASRIEKLIRGACDHLKLPVAGLSYNGQKLSPERTIESYDFPDGARLYVHLHPSGLLTKEERDFIQGEQQRYERMLHLENDPSKEDELKELCEKWRRDALRWAYFQAPLLEAERELVQGGSKEE